MDKQYYERVRAKIKANPWKWSGGVFLVVIAKLIEHRGLEWANKQLDEEATLVMPHVRDTLYAAIAHPWVSAFVLLASYSILMVAIAHISAITKLPRITLPIPSQDLELSSPDERRIRLTNHSTNGVNGLILSLINDRADNHLGPSRIATADALSYDSRKAKFCSSSDHTPIEIGRYGATPPGAIAKELSFQQESRWLLRIHDNRLELGNVTDVGILPWPGGDSNDEEIWLLALSIHSEALPSWLVKIRLQWSRGSSMILLSAPKRN